MIILYSGAAFMYNGAVVVACEGFISSLIKVVDILLLAEWTFITAVLVWRIGIEIIVREQRVVPQLDGECGKPQGVACGSRDTYVK